MRRYAVGFGCRRGATADEIAAAVTAATSGLSIDRAGDVGLATIAAKAGDPAVQAAAAILGRPVAFLDEAALRAVAARVVTLSPASLARFGTPSVAEAAALALGGSSAALIVPRHVIGPVTVAVALAIDAGLPEPSFPETAS